MNRKIIRPSRLIPPLLAGVSLGLFAAGCSSTEADPNGSGGAAASGGAAMGTGSTGPGTGGGPIGTGGDGGVIACEPACASGQLCSQGTCTDSCSAPLSQCGTTCVNTQTTALHCGSCEVSCSAGESCVTGMCKAPTTEPVSCDDVTDACPFEAGLTHNCVKRFALGINYAWHDFGADFGGLSQWALPGVAADSATYAAELADMSANGAKVVRWWMFPDFRGDGVEFDAAGDPSGLSATAQADILAALDLAEAQGVDLVLTIFSFDNFRPTRMEGDIEILGMTPMVKDAARRAKLVANVVKKAAEVAATSPNVHRLLGWDVINEPEWAVSPAAGAPNGGDFTPNEELTPVTLAEMKALINESIVALKATTPNAQVSVGWAAAKWAWAFSDVTGVDFHQPHIYGWVDKYWPYTSTPTSLGYGGKPTVMGEFYLMAMPFLSDDTPDQMATFNEVVSSWYDNGYAGAWSWQYNENASDLGLVKEIATTKGCSVDYEQ